MNKRQRRKQIKRLAYLLRTVDVSDQLRPSLILTPLSDWATRLGWCERFQTRDGYPWQRLTPKGQAARRELLRVMETQNRPAPLQAPHFTGYI